MQAESANFKVETPNALNSKLEINEALNGVNFSLPERHYRPRVQEWTPQYTVPPIL